MATAYAVNYKSAAEGTYGALIADFEFAYRIMKSLSEDFNRILIEASAASSGDESRSRIDRASRAYENARTEFEFAATRVNQFMIAQRAGAA